MQYSALVRARRFIHSNGVVHLMRWYYTKVWGVSVGVGSRISTTVKMDKTNPRGVTIGDYTAIAFEAAILSHDYVNGVHLTTKIGSHCFIGARSIIMPGVKIGDHCVVAAGTVVMRDVPSNSVIAGNPGRVLERDIQTGRFGIRSGPGFAKMDAA